MQCTINNDIGEIQVCGGYQQTINEYGICGSEFMQNNYIENYASHKTKFIGELGLLKQEQISFMCSEYANHWDKFRDLCRTIRINYDGYWHTCPIFAVPCLYKEIPGCKFKVSFSHDNGIYGIMWNTTDTDAIVKYIQENVR